MDAGRVRRLAALARIGLAPGEDAALAADLARTLGHLDALRAMDDLPSPTRPPAADSRPTAGLATLRDDVPGADPLTIHPSELAPAWRDGLFLLPRPPGFEPER